MHPRLAFKRFVCMLEKLGAYVVDCHRHAKKAEAKARETPDSNLKDEYLRIAQSWSFLARSYRFARTLENLVDDFERWSLLGATARRDRVFAAGSDAFPLAPEQFPQAWIDALPVGICICGADGVIVTYNKRVAEIWGRHPVRGRLQERYCGAYRLYLPDGRHIPHDRTPMAAVLRHHQSAEFEAIAQREDGSKVNVLLRVEPLFNVIHQFVGFVNCVQDITNYKLAERREVEAREQLSALNATEKRRQLFANEIKHRAKNNLAVVQAVVRNLLRRIPDREEASRAIDQSLTALSCSYDLLRDEERRSVSIHQLLDAALSVHTAYRDRFEVTGPEVPIPEQDVMTFSLVFHELATNALKYGALTTDQGRVRVTWQIADGILRLVWQERGGPRVAPPERRGFGSQLIETALMREGRKCLLSYPPDGLRWTFEAPLTSFEPAVAA